jgi:hypothetical protein
LYQSNEKKLKKVDNQIQQHENELKKLVETIANERREKQTTHGL